MIGRRLGNLLIAAGLILMVWPAATWVYGLYWQERLARSFPSAPVTTGAPVDVEPSVRRGPSPAPKLTAAKAKRPKAKQTRRARPAPRAGEALARLRIKRIGLDAVVIEGVDGVALRRGPGHLPTTGLPGERRNCAIAAHRDGWFQRLPEVRVGDAVHVQTMEGAYEYVVGEKKVVTPDRSDLLNRGRKPYLTLITCTGPGYPRSAYRLLVFCKLRDPSSNDVTEGGAADRTETAVVPALLRTKLAQQQKTGPVAAGRPVAARPSAAGRAAVPSKAPKARVLVAAHRPAVSRRAKPVQPPSPRKQRARTIARAAAAAKRAEKRAAAAVPKAPPPAPAAPPSPVVERQPDLDTPGTGEPAGDAPAAEEPADSGDGAQEETFPEADD